MAGQATELFNLASSFDPLSSYRQGQMTNQKFDIQQSMLDEQTKEIEADKAAEAASLEQQAGQPGQPVKLAKMANQMIPDAKLYNDDGSLTTAGQMNDMLVNSTKLAKQGKMMGMQAALIEDPYQRTQAMAESRRLIQTAQQDQIKARELNDKVKGDSIYAAAMSKDQAGWDAAIQAYQDTGLPLPKGIPTEYSPENAKKIAALAPAALQSKIRNDQLKEQEDARRAKREERAVLAAEAKARNNDGDGGGTNKVYESVDDKLNDSKYGVAKGKIPAKEQTIARRVMADSSEVLVGVNQLAHLTESGTRDLTGSTFSEAKGDGFLKAPAKAFTNKISNEDSLMYDSIMYPIVKNMSLFDNPDYRPTDADVKQKMQAYKAGANEPRSVQVQKMAELKNTYMAKAESYLDAGIFNANQAAALKKQMRAIEKAIPWNVNDAIDFSRQKEYSSFGEFIQAKNKGGKPSSAPEANKPSEKPMQGGKTITSQAEYDALKPGDEYIWNGRKLTKGAK